MTTPTPGPWEISKWTKRFAIEASSDNYRGLMCEVHREDFDPETAEANARLIAAAPEMLEMLKNIAAGRYDGAPDTARMRARSIVAKATGGTEAAR